MDSKQAKELLPIITAFSKGEDIQFNINTPASPVWVTTTTYSFNHDPSNYRIKPKKITTYTLFYRHPNKGWKVYFNYETSSEAEEHLAKARPCFPNADFKVVPVTFEE